LSKENGKISIFFVVFIFKIIYNLNMKLTGRKYYSIKTERLYDGNSKRKKNVIESCTLERMWVNQPSGLQPEHHLHGTRVLALLPKDKGGIVRVYFLDGPVQSQNMSSLALSKGWGI
jgi:hypothetical protein